MLNLNIHRISLFNEQTHRKKTIQKEEVYYLKKRKEKKGYLS